MTTLVEDIAGWVAELRYDMLPREVVNRTRLILLDTLGCALGALDAPPLQLARRVALEQGGNPQATPIGVRWKTSSDQAAFLDGIALRYLDLNDYSTAGGHPSINIAPALSATEARGLGGQDLILATVIGYEVQLRLREAAKDGKQEGWDHSTGVHYSTAAAAAKLFGLSSTQIAHALAIAGSHACTLAAVRKGKLSMWKGVAEAMAAKSGTFAALLARAGLTGPLAILEGNGGYKEVVAGALDETVLRKRPDEFLLLTSCVKLWPCVFVAQAPIAAALNLRRQRHFSPDDIKNIVIYLSAFSYEQQKKFLAAGLSSRESADHSAPYCVARALLDGAVQLEHFDEKSFSEPRAVALYKKVSLARADALPDKASVRLEIHLNDGGTLSEEVLYPPGHTENPVGETEIVKKFYAISENVLGTENTKKISDIVLNMEKTPSLTELLNALCPTRRALE
jgi:2-methylcitrate dehydratase